MNALLALLVPVLLAAQTEDLRPPRLTHFVEAEYPVEAEKARRSSAVVLALEIDAEGKVTKVEVAESGGTEFDVAAVKAAERFEFEPALVGGEPTSVRILYRYTFTLKELPKDPVVNFRGRIVERFSKAGLPGIVVSLPELGTSTVTDSNGRFAFADVPAGVHGLRVEGAGFISVKTEQELKQDLAVDLKLALERVPTEEEAVDEEEVVRAPRVRKEVTETRIEAAVARTIPGTQGDTVKVVQTMAGVGRASAGSGSLVVWGAAASDTRTYVDGVLIPRLFHSGGVRSTLASDLVKSVDLVPAGYGAEYGRALGGLLRVETVRPRQESGVHGQASLDIIDGSISLRRQLANGLTLMVGGRKSLLDLTFASVVPDEDRALIPIPSYYDYQAKLTYAPRAGEALELLFFGADDELERRTPSPDPANARAETTHIYFHRLALSYERVLDDGSSISVRPWLGIERSNTSSTFGEVPDLRQQDVLRGALRASFRRKLARFATLRAGLDLELNRSDAERAGSLSVPPREGDVTVFGLPPGDRVNVEAWSVASDAAAAYGTLELDLLDNTLRLQPGLRLEAFVVEGNRVVPVRGREPEIGYSRLELAADPRFDVSWRLSSSLTLHGAAGLYHQPPDPADLSAVFGNPSLGAGSALHTLAGAVLQLGESAAIELTGFRVQLWGLTERSALPTPPVARALVSEGEGLNVGAQLVGRYKVEDWLTTSVTYSLMRAERTDHPGEPARLFDADQTHSLQALASWNVGSGFELGARFRYATGFPRTEVIGSYFNGRSGVYEPIFGEHNAIRLPDFLQLDLRAAWSWRSSWVDFMAFLDIQNVTNRQNPEEVVYNFDFSQRGYIAGLPFLPVLGVRGEF